MDLLNPSPVLALPVTMWATARVFAGTSGLTEVAALRRLSPLGLREVPKGGEVSDAEPAPTNGAVQAAGALKELGLLTEVAGSGDAAVLRWTGGVPRSYDEFCDQMRDAVMAKGYAEDFGETRTPGGARDLLRGLAWILTTDPGADLFSATSVQRDRDASADDDRVFINPTRWNGFRYWAEALGFAAPALVTSEANAIIGDASRAIAATLRRSFPAGKDVPARTAIAELQERLPVLPGGTVSLAVGFPRPVDNQVDAATSFALLALEQSKEIALPSLSDATGTVQLAALDPGERVRLVTHIVVRGK